MLRTLKTHLEDKGGTRRTDLPAEGQRVIPQLLQVHPLNGRMQMAPLLNEVRKYCILTGEKITSDIEKPNTIC